MIRMSGLLGVMAQRICRGDKKSPEEQRPYANLMSHGSTPAFMSSYRMNTPIKKAMPSHTIYNCYHIFNLK